MMVEMSKGALIMCPIRAMVSPRKTEQPFYFSADCSRDPERVNGIPLCAATSAHLPGQPLRPLRTVAAQGFAASSFACSQVQYAIALLRLNMAFSPT